MAASKKENKGKGRASLDNSLLPFRRDTITLDEAEHRLLQKSPCCRNHRRC
jgi:hypothetical protein